jgi:TonB-dependent SusC/RagA subfamily outer membrane receptor
MIKTFTSLLFVLLSLSLGAQNFAENWEKVIEYEKNGSIRSALDEVNTIYEEAKDSKNEIQVIKTFFFRSKYIQTLEEDAQSLIIQNLRQDMDMVKDPSKTMLEFIYISCLNTYLTKNAVAIIRRTPFEENTSTDFLTWTLPDFKEDIDHYISKALGKKEYLKNIPLKDFQLILDFNGLENLENKSFYDFLLDKYIVLYNHSIDLSNYTIKDYKTSENYLFGNSSEFLSMDFDTIPESNFKKASLIFQEIERIHPGNPELVLNRMDYYNQSIFNDPLSYLKTLNQFQTTVKDTSVFQEVQLKRANLYIQLASKAENPEFNKKANIILDSILKTESRSNVYKNAFLKSRALNNKILKIQLEKFIYENESVRAFINFKNTDSLHLKIFRLNHDFYLKKHSYKGDNLIATILQNRTAVKSISYKLPNKDDSFEYSTEVLLPSLEKGFYAIVFAAQKSDFEDGEVKDFDFFTVTDLAILQNDQNNKDYFQVINRKTGMPIKKAEIDFDKRQSRTNKNGIGQIKREKRKPDDKNYGSLQVTNANDTLTVGLYKGYYYKYAKDDYEDFNGKVQFFLDRAIYRPGQKVYVKGIALQNKKNKKSVVPNLTVFVEVTDPNYKTIKELEIQTNEFGSFSFDFILPKNITGTFTIEANEPDDIENDPLYSRWRDEHKFWDYVDFDYSEMEFEVEEYKRPTFKIDFDPVKENGVVNQEVSVTGKATSFSGVNLNDSKVIYRVERKSYPNYWRTYYPEETKTIAEGETLTESDGIFHIDFNAIPYSKFDKKDLPIFQYTVYADITDSRGETQSAEVTVKMGYHNLALTTLLPNVINTKKENILKLNSTNLNGEFIPTKGKIDFYFKSALSPKVKDRVFPSPDIPGFTKEEFKKLFPYEKNIEDGNSESLVFSKEIDTETKKEISLDFLKSKAIGKYKLVFSATDSANNLIETSSEFTLIHSDEDLVDKLFTIKRINKNPFADGYVEVEIHSPIHTLFINVMTPEDSSFSYKQIILKDGYAKTKITFDRKNTENLTLGFQSYFENQFFEESLSIEKESDAAIEIAIRSFRNKIEPGSHETWSFSVNQNNRGIRAEVLASMYDSSLDQFIKTDWETLSIYTYYGSSYYSRISDLSSEKSYTTLRGLNPYLPQFYFSQKYVDLFWFGFDFTNPRGVTGYQNGKKEISTIPPGASTVFGIVTDDTGLPLPGVNVIVEGTSRGTQTDFDGYYSIDVAQGEELVFSYVGFNIQTILVDSNEYNISLDPGSALDEVVVTGYSASEEMVMTSAVVNVSIEELLAGKVPGVLVAPNNEISGAGTLIRIRGTSSISSTSPLVIIDGVPMVFDNSSGNSIDENSIISLSGLDPNNIANLSILKGEEAISLYGASAGEGVIVITTKSALEELTQIETRKNFDETAFFKPHLRTDRNGNISFDFTSPEALTQWKLRLFAHDKKGQSGYLENFTITQKELMIAPNMPRFFREKDSISISARISNLTSKEKSGIALLQLFDAATMEAIDMEMGNEINQRTFKTTSKGNDIVTWTLKIPEGLQGVQYKVVAKSGNFTDGEENLIPVLTNTILVTESIPLWVRGNTEKEYSFPQLKENASTTLKNHQLTLEYTSNPTWLAIQALPYLMEYEHDCSEQVFARYYANSIASEILNSNPKIADYFKNNKVENLESKLEQNEELKSIILSETPWFRDSQTDDEKKARMALLFDLDKLAEAQESTFNKLREQQMSNGGFPWFEGGEPNEFITRHIVAGFGKLNKRKNASGQTYKVITDNALNFIDEKFLERNKKREESDKITSFLNTVEKHYLYTRSFYLESNPPNDSLQGIINKRLIELKKDWLEKPLYQKALSSIIFYRFGDSATSKKIVHNLRETASNNEDWGMYWIENKPGWDWYTAPIETQALLIEAFAEIENDKESVDAMKVWLLKNKQVKQWSSTKSTSEAIDAMLRFGKDWTNVKDQTLFKLGDSKLLDQKLSTAEKEVETGYFKINFDAIEIQKDMANLSIQNKSEVPGFGGFYWQYFEEADKIESNSEKPLSVKKELYLKKNTPKGQQLQRITEKNPLKLGNLITVRLIVSTKEDMEYVHLKDMRASAFEPVDVISEYTYTDGLGYYKSTRDAATHFFFDKINKGTYVLEYEVRANNIGNFSNGISNIQSMYAPEFGDHSEGIRVIITE